MLNDLTRWLTILLLTLLSCTALGDEVLPEPLTLAAALATAQNPAHYELVEIEQRLQALRAELGIERGNYGFSLDLRGQLSEVGPSDFAPDTESNDSAASLVLSKPLYDFGLQGAREKVLALQLETLEYQQRLLIEQRRLSILQKYFAVLNADNNFISENEALAIDFNRWDRALQRQELGQVAEIEVLRLQSIFEVTRQKRQLAQQQQRLTRARLAEAMGYPRQPPSDLEIPQIDSERTLPSELGPVVDRALSHSLEAQLAAAKIMATQAAIGIADANDNPSLDFEVEVSSYARDSRLRDDWRVTLLFEIPLISGSAAPRVELATALHGQALANQQQMHSQLRLEVLQLWEEIQQLRLEIDGRNIERSYRESYLDRSRAEYELEFKTDLGDSMALYSRSNTERLQAIYAYELAYQRLAALVGDDFLNQAASSQ